jgi:hypothetical protein
MEIDLGCAYKRFDDNKLTLWSSLVRANLCGINSKPFTAKVLKNLHLLAHESNREPETPAQNRETKLSDFRNRTLQFCQFWQQPRVLLAWSSSSNQVTSGWWREKTTLAVATRSDCKKNKTYKKTRAKTRVYVNCINSIISFINWSWRLYL